MLYKGELRPIHASKPEIDYVFLVCTVEPDHNAHLERDEKWFTKTNRSQYEKFVTEIGPVSRH